MIFFIFNDRLWVSVLFEMNLILSKYPCIISHANCAVKLLSEIQGLGKLLRND